MSFISTREREEEGAEKEAPDCVKERNYKENAEGTAAAREIKTHSTHSREKVQMMLLSSRAGGR